MPQFYFSALNFAGDMSQNGSRVDIYVQVPYEYLQFVKEGDRYVASYEVDVRIITPKGKDVVEKVWTQKVIADNFDQTTSRAFWDISQAFLNLPFGDIWNLFSDFFKEFARFSFCDSSPHRL